MLYKLYQKQVEAWKERFVRSECTDDTCYALHDYIPEDVSPKDLLSSRHKDTIELLEAEIVRKKGMKINDETSSMQDPSVAWNEGHDSAIDEDIAYLEEELRKLKNEQ